MDVVPGYADLLYQPLTLEYPTEFVPVMSIKEELPDVKDELIPGHYLQVSSTNINTGCNADSDGIKLEDLSDEDPLSTVQEESGCDSAVKASYKYKPPERNTLEVTKSELYCKRIISKNKDLYNTTLYNEGKPANCITEYGKIEMETVRHSDERKYICDECEKCFSVRRNFIAHLLVHSGERKHKCGECEKCFTHRSHLVTHSLIHSGERKHKCKVCGKCFTQRGHLLSHSLIHSGERKHRCEICGKCFTDRRNLVGHSVIHSGDRKHKCEDCGKCFSRRGHLVRHSLIHSSDRKLKCEDCGECFTRCGQLLRHSLIH